MDDEEPSSDPPDAQSERDRELYSAVLFLLKWHLQKLARERGDLKPQPSEPHP
jgi:hypothetical protein